MTWTLAKVTRAPHQDAKLALLLQSVTMEFVEFDGNGVATGKSRTYTEPNVSNVSDDGIAKLARDQLRQLDMIAKTPAGDLDINVIRALVSPPPPPDKTPLELAQEAFVAKRGHLAELRALLAEEIIPANDAEYVALLAEAQADLVALRQMSGAGVGDPVVIGK